MTLTFTAAKLLTPTEEINDGAVVISDQGKIIFAGYRPYMPDAGDKIVDLGERILAPGLIDIHVHGGQGIRFEQGAAPEEMTRYATWAASTGVTGYLRSIAAPTTQELVDLIRAHVAQLKIDQGNTRALGLHLEGPYLSPARKGAFPSSWLRGPSNPEVQRTLEAGEGWIRQVTIAPELPGALAAAALFQQSGVVVAMGHTDADFDTASLALQGHFSHVTHTFNAQSRLKQRAPGVVGAVLASDRITAELIADIIHVHPAVMKTLVRCLGNDRVVLVTDAMAAAGLPDGEYELAGQPIAVKAGCAHLLDGTLAGSTVTLAQCVRNLIHTANVPLDKAVCMASLNPACAIGLSNQMGSLEEGKDADLIVIDEQVNVYLTMVKGKIVYQA
jgi:N-acetylglucosamine-6-phosphate deacetylase